MKHEWRKSEKYIYLPKNTPELIDLPEFGYFMIQGEGNPNNDAFPAYVQALYAVSYAIKMSYKKGLEPSGFYDYSVYPLEGIWDLKPEAKDKQGQGFKKEDLVFKLMIRQPDFVDAKYATKMLEMTKQKKPQPLLDQVSFEHLKEGKCIQMLHLGSYDDEPASFAQMETFAEENGWNRISKTHKEIYLTDARKTPPEKLKTVLRFWVS